jgi:hypothetical protein
VNHTGLSIKERLDAFRKSICLVFFGITDESERDVPVLRPRALARNDPTQVCVGENGCQAVTFLV